MLTEQNKYDFKLKESAWCFFYQDIFVTENRPCSPFEEYIYFLVFAFLPRDGHVLEEKIWLHNKLFEESAAELRAFAEVADLLIPPSSALTLPSQSC